MIGRRADFATSDQAHGSLGLLWGRRRIGKSFLLQAFVEQAGGFYYEAVRGSKGEALRDLGAKLGLFAGSGAPLALEDWEGAVQALLALGRDGRVVVVLDEFPYLLEHSPELESVIQRALGARSSSRAPGQARPHSLRLRPVRHAEAAQRHRATPRASGNGLADVTLRLPRDS